MSFDTGFVDAVGAADEVEIDTRRRSGETVRTVIWAVVDDGRVYVRSVRAEDGAWYRGGRANRARRRPGRGRAGQRGAAPQVRAPGRPAGQDAAAGDAADHAAAGAGVARRRPRGSPPASRLRPQSSTARSKRCAAVDG